MMVEIPSNVLLPEFAKYFDGFSIGSNDLTQLTLGAIATRRSSPRSSTNGTTPSALIAQAIQQPRRAGRPIGLCAQAPSDYRRHHMATEISRTTTPPADRSLLERRLNDIGWGLLLMLTGVVWLLPGASVPPGTWLFGVAAILIGINVLRYVKHLAVSAFSLVLGAVALAAAIGEAQRTEPPLVALFLLAIGASIVARAAWGKAHRDDA